MATATINGKPSLFITPTEIPTARINPTADLQNNVSDAVRIANEMATVLSTAETEMTDEEMLNDPEFQAEYNAWCEKLDEEWRNDPEAQRQFDEWCDAEERKARQAELETAEQEAWEAHLEAQAEEAELARLGEAYLIGANTNHDLIWQQGGEV